MTTESESHELIAALKNLAIELGRIPTRDEFRKRVPAGGSQVDRHFGGYSPFLAAAGLGTHGAKRVIITREMLFGRDVQEVVEAHEPRPRHSVQDFKPILCIGDTHFPFAHQPTLEKVYRFAEKEQPAHIVQLGDLQDQFSHSRFPASRNYYKPDEEMELARKQSLEFWTELKRACPKAECYQITGNHDVRALRLILQSAPTLETIVKDAIQKLYEFDGVKTIHDYREELIIQDIMFHHGYMSRHGQQRDFVQQNLVSGHTHRGAVVYRPLNDRTLWHLDAGFVGDAEAKALSYTMQKTTGWTLGMGFIDEYGPRFVPL